MTDRRFWRFGIEKRGGATFGVSFRLWRGYTGHLLKNGESTRVSQRLWSLEGGHLLWQGMLHKDTGEKNTTNPKIQARLHHKPRDTPKVVLFKKESERR